jgi:tRNA nucleotidyltransferase (CCA-adding enzyme)
MEIYQVGGAVRDRLLGRTVKERDYVVVGASPKVLLEKGFKPVGKDFPVFLHPTTHEEYALARTERKRGPGYTGFSFYAAPDVSLEEDLKRRDLTINAIAEKPDGTLIDPYHGYEDLQQKVLRHVSEAFVEDPVRILRVARFMARFASLGFHIAEETLSLMQVMVRNGEVDALVPERIWREFLTALKEPTPIAFIQTLRTCEALAKICPELDILFQLQSPLLSSIFPNKGEYALAALQSATRLSASPVVRFSTLMQYIAEHSQDVLPVQNLIQRWRLPTLYRDLLMLSVQYRSQVHASLHATPFELLKLLEQTDALRRPERFRDLLTVCEADWCLDSLHHEKPYVQRNTLLKAYEIIQAVSVKPLLAMGYQGLVLKEQLNLARIQALQTSELFQKST